MHSHNSVVYMKASRMKSEQQVIDNKSG